MKTNIFTSDKILTLIAILTLFLTFSSVEIFAQKTLSTIVIDAGHGGKDSGALGRKSKEKDIVLSVAKQLGQMITDSFPEINTIYTRETDVFIPLKERATIANKAKADLFISIHANSSKKKDVKGAETYVLGLHRSKDNLEVAQKENSVIVLEDDYTNTYQGFDPSQPESYIIFELMANTHLEQSIQMASQVQDAFVKSDRGDRGVKQAGFLVLRETSMPSILIELGFISNTDEEKYMNSPKGKDELVNSIFRAFKTYKIMFDDANKVKAQKKEPEKTKEAPQPSKEEPVQGIVYKVQIANTSKPLEQLPTQYGTVDVIEENGTYKYMVGGITKKYSEISTLQKKVKVEYPDCFIVAFENGKKVTVKYAKKHEND